MSRRRSGPSSDAPSLGIGLPVFNGERYLRETLDSLLAQTFTDFEILVLDNVSTDATAEIAKEYARNDSRIRYERNREHLGPAANFNVAFRRTRGRYFKWAAHDDLLHPEFLARCVAALTDDPAAVLAAPKARIIDESGTPIEDYDPALNTAAWRRVERLEALLHDHKCFQIFGVMRRSALDRTNLIGVHVDGDGVLLQHLALLGPWIEVPEFLFFPRRHAGQSATMVGDYWNYAVWFDPSLRGSPIFPHWRWCFETLRVILRAPMGVVERAACLVVLGRALRRRVGILRGDVMYHLRPRLVALGVPEHLLRRSTRPGRA